MSLLNYITQDSWLKPPVGGYKISKPMEKANSSMLRKHSPIQNRSEFTKAPELRLLLLVFCLLLLFPIGKDTYSKSFLFCGFYIFLYASMRCGKQGEPNFSFLKKYTSLSFEYVPQLWWIYLVCISDAQKVSLSLPSSSGQGRKNIMKY